MLHSFSSPFLFHLSTKNLYVSLIIIADKEAHSGKSIKRSKKLKNTVPSLAAYLYWVSIVLIYGGKIFYVEKQLGRITFFSGCEIIAGIIFTPDIPFVFYFFMTAGNFTLPGRFINRFVTGIHKFGHKFFIYLSILKTMSLSPLPAAS